MKKILALAAAAALAAGASAYAANPFSDVSTSDWAYQAVSDLSNQGVVEGYPDGTFKGQNNITRYEMAQIIARLMAKEDQLNAEQRATVDKLAGEYADELDNLGVRVSNLEKKVGNISWSGDSRMRYIEKLKDDDKTETYDGRIRLKVKGQVNENTTVNGRILTKMDFKDGNNANTTMDRLYVQHQFGDAAKVILGRYEVDIGSGSTMNWLYANTFDGAEADFQLSKNVSLGVGYGRFFDAKDEDFRSAESFYAQAKADLDVVQVGVDYYKVNDQTFDDQVIGGNLTIPFGDFRVFGDYYTNTEANQGGDAWDAGIGYGNLKKSKAGTFDLNVAHFDIQDQIYHKSMSGPQLASVFDLSDGQHVKFWHVNGDVALAKNIWLHGEYAFNVEGEDKDYSDAATLSLNYQF